VLFVFPAGNEGDLNQYFGSANEAGLGGNANRILSPGTAKNVITVGAVEQLRNITNEVVTTENGQSFTNAMWQPLSDSNDQVAGYSSRGNVGVGIEGVTGRLKPDVVAPAPSSFPPLPPIGTRRRIIPNSRTDHPSHRLSVI
jgi:hypothetical protein